MKTVTSQASTAACINLPQGGVPVYSLIQNVNDPSFELNVGGEIGFGLYLVVQCQIERASVKGKVM